MKKSRTNLLACFLIVGGTLFSGCAMIGEKTAAPSPTPSASPTPTVSEALASAKDYLSRALSELRNRNTRGALELIDLASGSLKTAAGGASAVTSTAIEGAAKSLESVKTMIANKDKKAEETLAKVETTVSGLVQSAASMVGDAKEKARGAIGAAADAVKAAVAVSPSPSPSPKNKKK